jgi:hypothetical protein
MLKDSLRCRNKVRKIEEFGVINLRIKSLAAPTLVEE